MKATGIVRRIDDLGRVVIPKEIRRTMRIREGDPLEIYTDTDGQVIFKKYSPMGELSEFAVQICDALHKTTGEIAAVRPRHRHCQLGRRRQAEPSSGASAASEERMTARLICGPIPARRRSPRLTSASPPWPYCAYDFSEGDVLGQRRWSAVDSAAAPCRRNRERSSRRRSPAFSASRWRAESHRKKKDLGTPGGLSLCVQPLRALYAAGAP